MRGSLPARPILSVDGKPKFKLESALLVAFLFSAALLRSCTEMSIPNHFIAFHVVDFALDRSACCINVIVAFFPTQFLKRPDSNGSGEIVSTFPQRASRCRLDVIGTQRCNKNIVEQF
jgi:hypothetical protein